MKTIMKKSKLSLYLASVMITILFSSCGGGGSSSDCNIDKPAGNVPICQTDSNGQFVSTNALFVLPQTVVTKTKTGTIIKIWHFSDSDEYICVIAGGAATYYYK
jgi:hypothetical protein